MRPSVMHYSVDLYSVTSSFAMVSSPARNVSIVTWSFSVPFTFFIFLSAASHAINGGSSKEYVCIVMARSVS